MNSSNIPHTHTKDVMYLIRGIYNPTSYIDERVKKIQMSYIKLLDLNTYLRCQGNKLIETGGDVISQTQTVGISTDQTT